MYVHAARHIHTFRAIVLKRKDTCSYVFPLLIAELLKTTRSSPNITICLHAYKQTNGRLIKCVVVSVSKQPKQATKLSWLSRAWVCMCVCVLERWEKPFCYVFSSAWNSVYWLFGLGPILIQKRTYTLTCTRPSRAYAHAYVCNTIKKNVSASKTICSYIVRAAAAFKVLQLEPQMYTTNSVNIRKFDRYALAYTHKLT